jgi:hypothetical protein
VQCVWPSLTVQLSGDRLVIAGEVQPGELFETYQVRIIYTSGGVPEAFVIEPALRPRDDGQQIPHVYPGPRPCLYLPGAREWTSEKLIAETVIPWLMLWLEYYELWHATGDWQGGGEHPQPEGARAPATEDTNQADIGRLQETV